MTPAVETVMFEVVGFDEVCGLNWKVFSGDAGFERVLDFVVLCVVDFEVSFSFVVIPIGLLGEEDREEDCDLVLVEGSLKDCGNE